MSRTSRADFDPEQQSIKAKKYAKAAGISGAIPLSTLSVAITR